MKKKKAEPFKLMTMEEIEAMFEKKEQEFKKRMVEFERSKMQPLTMKLILKYAFAQDKPQE